MFDIKKLTEEFNSAKKELEACEAEFSGLVKATERAKEKYDQADRECRFFYEPPQENIDISAAAYKFFKAAERSQAQCLANLLPIRERFAILREQREFETGEKTKYRYINSGATAAELNKWYARGYRVVLETLVNLERKILLERID